MMTMSTPSHLKHIYRRLLPSHLKHIYRRLFVGVYIEPTTINLYVCVEVVIVSYHDHVR
jgi:hypothetical protein